MIKGPKDSSGSRKLVSRAAISSQYNDSYIVQSTDHQSLPKTLDNYSIALEKREISMRKTGTEMQIQGFEMEEGTLEVSKEARTTKQRLVEETNRKKLKSLLKHKKQSPNNQGKRASQDYNSVFGGGQQAEPMSQNISTYKHAEGKLTDTRDRDCPQINVSDVTLSVSLNKSK